MKKLRLYILVFWNMVGSARRILVEMYKFRHMGLTTDQSFQRAYRNEMKHIDDETQRYRDATYLVRCRIAKIKRQAEEMKDEVKPV